MAVTPIGKFGRLDPNPVAKLCFPRLFFPLRAGAQQNLILASVGMEYQFPGELGRVALQSFCNEHLVRSEMVYVPLPFSAESTRALTRESMAATLYPLVGLIQFAKSNDFRYRAHIE
jgi:hypothetical protein